jgi:hypothetical protein
MLASTCEKQKYFAGGGDKIERALRHFAACASRSLCHNFVAMTQTERFHVDRLASQ